MRGINTLRTILRDAADAARNRPDRPLQEQTPHEIKPLLTGNHDILQHLSVSPIGFDLLMTVFNCNKYIRSVSSRLRASSAA